MPPMTELSSEPPLRWLRPRRREARCGSTAAALVLMGALLGGCGLEESADIGTPTTSATAETMFADGPATSSAVEPSATPTSGADPDQGDARVARHIDGDSLELDIDGEVIEVRLRGINAPELDDCQGPAARDALALLLDGRPIDVVGSEQDRFGRLLVSLEVDGLAVDDAMVRQGWALALSGEAEHLVGAMHAAAEDGIGWWSESIEGCPRVDADIRVIDAEPDPPGRDDENLNGEFVVVANLGDAAVALDGWALRDESTGNRYVFGAVTLDPGDEVTVRTGCGDDRDDEVFWCSRQPVWSNHGETVLLLGPGGTLVDHRFLEASR